MHTTGLLEGMYDLTFNHLLICITVSMRIAVLYCLRTWSFRNEGEGKCLFGHLDLYERLRSHPARVLSHVRVGCWHQERTNLAIFVNERRLPLCKRIHLLCWCQHTIRHVEYSSIKIHLRRICCNTCTSRMIFDPALGYQFWERKHPMVSDHMQVPKEFWMC